MLVELVKNLPDTTVLVFIENEVDKRNRLYKAVKEKGYISELNEQSDNDIIKWVVGLLKRENRMMNDDTIRLFLPRRATPWRTYQGSLKSLYVTRWGVRE